MCRLTWSSEPAGELRSVAADGLSDVGQKLAIGFDSSGAETLYSSDQFRMYCYKVLSCSQRTVHDWSACPFAHPNEKAARRDIHLYNYDSIACPDVLATGRCSKGNACKMAHSVFEYWMHPKRYRTQMCRDGLACTRKVCFFAHSEQELRYVPGVTNDSPDPFSKSGRKKAAAAAAAGCAAKSSLGPHVAIGGSPTLSGSCSVDSCNSNSSNPSLLLFDGAGSSSWGGSPQTSIVGLSPNCDQALLVAAVQVSAQQQAAAAAMSAYPTDAWPTNYATSYAAATSAEAVTLVEMLSAYQQQADAYKQRAALAAAAAETANTTLAAYAAALGLEASAFGPSAAAAVPAAADLNSILVPSHSLGLSGALSGLTASSLGLPGHAISPAHVGCSIPVLYDTSSFVCL